MDTVFLFLLLVLAVVISNIIFWRFDSIPVAFFQIAAGLILSTLPIYANFHLEPEVFLLGIISVLMFNDGQHTSMSRLTHQFGTTFSLSVELAIVSIVVVGFVTHLLIPALSLALAFALGAIITPTDAVAVSSITNKMVIPKDVMTTLENESLFNDASGIVALNLAIAAAVTGQFSVMHGIGNFLYVFFGGIIVGAILGSLIVMIRLRFINMNIDTASVLVPFTLLTPFAVYLIAEALGVSGILAVVMTGLLHGVQQNRLKLTSSRVQIIMTNTWSVVSSLLNGIVFVLLGLSLPRVIINISQHHGNSSVATLFGVGILLYLIMTLLRYLWTRFDFARIRAWDNHQKTGNSFIMALSGVHGTITLAMAFSLPMTLNGQTFNARNDIIYIASIVILASLIVPTLVLPFFLPKQKIDFTQAELSQAKDEMVNNAIKMVATNHGNSASASQIVTILDGQRMVIERGDRNTLNQLFDKCYEIEKQTVDQMIENDEVSVNDAQIYLRVAQRIAIQNQQNPWQRIMMFFNFRIRDKVSMSESARKKRQLLRQKKRGRKNVGRGEMIKRNKEMWTMMRDIEVKPYADITKFLNTKMTNENAREVSIVRTAYDQRHRRLVGEQSFVDEQNAMLSEAFQEEYNFIQNQILSKRYSRELGRELNEQVSTDRVVFLQSIED
ncbi:cation:proton antiporter [Companilactobacillus sp.]|jgi:CPA1 family monovalent cation:H+ antiporter|uniref:cation:proton antiporter n=1 Tax=Companilactobacillus sp. TaxID=2767905 RepID=UPI0025BB24D8|nr:sodium:proton antiporter [Companilactobacillus sp.]MCH4008781.1 sodium:proton antiporter [Companilactobacillus sp.]MCH4051040.1 sodium:proton antiporter [Companilactobacillus sp.]MCH4076724.1 sodium:proton antiporter [Companilactobacillus sp.]MCH4125299.1 sodium:proton antiporter [Companilactobacillus sp.]MCH4131839.1 sodium:proton antiporter [Companilactobacillus sp.]